MKRLKLITKFFFQQKCDEIWEKIKQIPYMMLNLSKAFGIFMLIAAPTFAVIMLVGFVCVKFLYAPYNHNDPIFYAYWGWGFIALLGGAVAITLIYMYIKWIKENIDLAKDRADRELGLTSTTFVTDKEVDKQISKNKIARKRV